jgi:hypothetical protein
MTKVRVLKAGGFSGKKFNVGDVVNVKSTLAGILQADGRAEIVDDQVPPTTKSRAGASRTGAGGARRRGAA